MSLDLATAVVMTLFATATPILIAGLGELVVEKSGVMNIGIDGMMLLGALAAVVVVQHTGSYLLGAVAAAGAGICAALIFGLLTVLLGANQIVTGLALALFGSSFSTLVGQGYAGNPITLLGPVLPQLTGHFRILFGHSVPVYFGLAAAVLVWWMLNRTRTGIILRATGEDHDSVHCVGYSVIAVRMSAVAFGGAMAGIAGSCFPFMLTPQWAVGLTSGRGWIALALVVFATWRPLRLLAGAYFFAIVLTLEVYAKAGGVHALAPEVWAALPYLTTLLALVLISLRPSSGTPAPACLGKPFYGATK